MEQLQIQVNEDIWQQVWSEEEKLNYGSTPMFMVEAVKIEKDIIRDIQKFVRI